MNKDLANLIKEAMGDSDDFDPYEYMHNPDADELARAALNCMRLEDLEFHIKRYGLKPYEPEAMWLRKIGCKSFGKYIKGVIEEFEEAFLASLNSKDKNRQKYLLQKIENRIHMAEENNNRCGFKPDNWITEKKGFILDYKQTVNLS